MAALNGWVSTLKPDATVNCAAVAASLYSLAEAMMAERAKRMPAQPMHAAPADPQFADGTMVAVPFFDAQTDIVHQFVSKRKGQRMTCTEILRGAFMLNSTVKPDQQTLQRIGKILRQIGLKRCRSGGKDYYQL